MASDETATATTAYVETGEGRWSKAPIKGWRRKATAEVRCTWHQSRFGLCSFPIQETPKLLVPSMYLVSARHSSNRGGTTAQIQLHSLKHEPCNCSRLRSTKPFL